MPPHPESGNAHHTPALHTETSFVIGLAASAHIGLSNSTAGGLLVIIRALISVFSAVLRSAASTFLLIASMMVTAIVVLALLGVFGVGLTGFVGRVLSRRRSQPHD